jgi:hypothetical protein
MFTRYKSIIKRRMDWKSTFIVNTATIGLTFTGISESVKIGAMLVGIVWTIIQIVNGVNQFTDRRNRLRNIKKARKKKRNDKKL